MSDPRITKKQADLNKVKRWLARGLTMEQMAEASGRSVRTIYSYARQIRAENAGRVARVDMYEVLGQADDEYAQMLCHRYHLLSRIDSQAKAGEISAAQAIAVTIMLFRDIERARNAQVLIYLKCGVPPITAEMTMDKLTTRMLQSLPVSALEKPVGELTELVATSGRESGVKLALG